MEDENPTIGILLCKERNDALVEITLQNFLDLYYTMFPNYKGHLS